MVRLPFLIVVFAASALSAATFRLPESDAQWSRVQSQHFDVVTSAGERNALWTVQRLETLYSAMSRLRGGRLPSQWDARRLQFFTFGRRRDLQPYLDALFATDNVTATGAYFSLRDGGIAFVDASGPSETAEHELIHAALGSPGRPLPLWLEEGLAEFFSHYRSGAQRLTFGRLILQRTSTLRAEQSLPMTELFSRQPGDPAVFGTPKRQSIFYAQSWAAVHALMSVRHEPLERMTRLVALMSGGAAADAALLDVYGWSVEELGSAVERYGSVISPRPLAIHMPVVRTSDAARRTRLEASDALTLLGEAMAEAKPLDPAIARMHYDAVLDSNPDHPRALGALANVTWNENVEKSEALFARAVAAAPDDFSLRLARGELLLRFALGDVPSVQTPEHRVELGRKARAQLAEARRVAPRDARAAGCWAASHAVESTPSPEAITLLATARRALPWRADLAAAELVMLYNTSPAAAESAFRQLAQSTDPQLQFAARSVRLDSLFTTVNRMAQSGDHAAAAAILRRIAAESSGDQRAQFEAQAVELDRVAAANREIELYNAAVARFNARDYTAAEALLDQLITGGRDEDTLEAARNLKKLAARRPQ